MAQVTIEAKVICVHGEGDRATVNALEKHRRVSDRDQYVKTGQQVPATVEARSQEEPDEPADVIIVLRDDEQRFRVEHPVLDWDEVERWKEICGWDPEKRHWGYGGKVKVTIEPVTPAPKPAAAA